MSKFKLSSPVLTGILVAALAVIAFLIRVVFSYSQIFKGDWIKYSSADAYFQMRLVDNFAHNLPSASNFDPYLIYPGGTSITITHAFAKVMASISSLFGLVIPSQHTIDLVGVYTPPVLAALTIIIVYFIGRELIGKWGGIFSATLLTILPGEFLSRTKLGFTDYHCFEVFITSLFILFLVLALKAARKNDLRFSHLWKPDWTVIRKPVIYSLIAGVCLALYGMAWSGAPMFTFVVFIFLVVQFVIDHIKSRSTEYLSVAGIIVFLAAFILSALATVSTIVPASSLVVVIACAVLGVVSRFMAVKKLKSGYYPISIVVMAGAGFGLFYLIFPSIVRSMLGKFEIFSPSGAQLTTIEMQPLISSVYGNSFAVVWGNYNTTFFISMISLLVLLYVVYKYGNIEKTLLLVWSVIMLISNLAQRRFGYYFAVNIALLTGYLTWLVLEYAWAHIFTNQVKQAIAKAKNIKRRATRKQEANPLIAPYSVMSLVVIVVFFTGYFWSIEPTIDSAKQAPYAPSDAWCSALDWMRENTPEPLGDPEAYYRLENSEDYLPYSVILSNYPDTANNTEFYKELDEYYPYPDTAYGVLSWWDYGYWITRIARRLPSANPSQDPRAIKDAAAFFTAQDEETANKIMEKLDSDYIIIDYQTAYVDPNTGSGKLWAIITWGGMAVTDFYDLILTVDPDDSTRLIQRPFFYPEYYRCMAVRMYNFDCQAVIPSSVWVIKHEMQQDQAGNVYNVLTDAQEFTTYEEADTFVSSQEEGIYRIASMNPMVPCTPLEALEDYEVVYNSPQGMQYSSDNLTPQVKIFQYDN